MLSIFALKMDFFDERNLFYIIIFVIMFTVLLAVIINLSRMPDKYVLSDKFFDIDGRSKPIPVELYLKETRKETSLGSIGEKIGKTKKKPKKLNKYEEECRRIFEKLFHEKFPNIRPTWLINPVTGSLLELDIYCEDLKLACEYDGRQHVEKVDKFHKNEKQFQYQRAKDNFKTRACKEKGIDLIRIPHWIKYEKLEEHIIGELKKIGRL